MANNILVQWQGVGQTIANIQAQLNTLAATALPAISSTTAGQFAVVNVAGTGYVLVQLSGDVTSSSATPGQVTVLRVNGNPVASTAPTPGQIWVWNGTTFVPVSISGDGTMSAGGVLTLTKFGGVTPSITGGTGITVTGTFPSLVISSSGAASGFSSLSTITLGASGGNTQTATIQLKDSTGANIAAVQKIEVYMATDALGATPSVSGAAVGVSVTTGALLQALTAKLHFDLITNASGAVALSFDNTGASGPYTDRIVLVLPTGGVLVSGLLFAQSTAYTSLQVDAPVLQKPIWVIPGRMGQ